MDVIVRFVTQHGTVLLFLLVLAEQIGLPIPVIPVLIIAGTLVGTGQMNFDDPLPQERVGYDQSGLMRCAPR
ncbi:MAG: hypothetical protein LV473_15055 [Nitrospira sp.]|nr:hypothetical protein [Nitrospira sp.]